MMKKKTNYKIVGVGNIKTFIFGNVKLIGTHLLPPLASLRSTTNFLSHGKMMYFMYSRHGFPSTIFGGQYAFFIFTFTSAYDIGQR